MHATARIVRRTSPRTEASELDRGTLQGCVVNQCKIDNDNSGLYQSDSRGTDGRDYRVRQPVGAGTT